MRRIVLSATLLAGVIAIAAYSSPALAANTAVTKTTTTTFTLNCNTDIVSGPVTVKTTQTYPASVAAGTTFTVKWKSVTTVGGALASAAEAIAPGGTEKGTVTLDNDLSTDATPATKNIAGKKGLPEQGKIGAPTSKSFPIYTPPKGSTPGYFVTSAFKAGTKGTDKISAQDDNATIKIYNSSGQYVTTTSANCTPSGTPTVIATITVT